MFQCQLSLLLYSPTSIIKILLCEEDVKPPSSVIRSTINIQCLEWSMMLKFLSVFILINDVPMSPTSDSLVFPPLCYPSKQYTLLRPDIDCYCCIHTNVPLKLVQILTTTTNVQLLSYSVTNSVVSILLPSPSYVLVTCALLVYIYCIQVSITTKYQA